MCSLQSAQAVGADHVFVFAHVNWPCGFWVTEGWLQFTPPICETINHHIYDGVNLHELTFQRKRMAILCFKA